MASNPFHDLYLSESISEDDLVKFFSPIIVDHSGIVFEPGNVIIRGLQGTGKTMLLNLLRPELRLAYFRSNTKFPVSPCASKFIGAGLNLRKCGILEFAQHLEKGMDLKQVQELALLFADFFNYWVVADLIKSIQLLSASASPELLREIGLIGSSAEFDQFAKRLASDPCWFGALEGVTTLPELNDRFEKRFAIYRSFLNLNTLALPNSVTRTKTVIGDPLLKAVDALRLTKVLESKTKIFVRIDQYEQLTTLNVVGTNYGTSCQELIHKALAARDGRISYRIGTRTHGWDERPTIYSTYDVLERKRDFDILDMDELFMRREDRATWTFPKFAQDIFSRRIDASQYGRASSLHMSTVLGKSLTPTVKAEGYVKYPLSRRKIIESAVTSLPGDTPNDWKDYIGALAERDVLSAWLSCAWVRQKGVKRKNSIALGLAPSIGSVPWEAKPYWHKERVQLGLMQLASANRQAPMWDGEADVTSLSGGQILVFLFLLQHIWDAWLRDRRGEPDDDFQFPMRPEVQSQGVREASAEWLSKQTEGPNAYKRRSFVDTLGKHFYVKLTGDRAMSNPGANGFTLENGELARNPDIKGFLMEAVGYGDLVEAPHTSKTKGERRTKYYLAPVLSPYFRIPSVHTKEPEYVTINQVRSWMDEPPATQKQNRRSSSGDAVPDINSLSQKGFWDEDVA
jgi:hypothetical protein